MVGAVSREWLDLRRGERELEGTAELRRSQEESDPASKRVNSSRSMYELPNIHILEQSKYK
mgnify:CR=1 FL=1